MVTEALKKVKVSRSTLYRWRQTDADFDEKWTAIDEEVVEELEAVVMRRAKNGSDVLAMFILKAKRPGVYRERLSIDDDRESQKRRELDAAPEEELDQRLTGLDDNVVPIRKAIVNRDRFRVARHVAPIWSLVEVIGQMREAQKRGFKSSRLWRGDGSAHVPEVAGEVIAASVLKQPMDATSGPRRRWLRPAGRDGREDGVLLAADPEAAGRCGALAAEVRPRRSRRGSEAAGRYIGKVSAEQRTRPGRFATSATVRTTRSTARPSPPGSARRFAMHGVRRAQADRPLGLRAQYALRCSWIAQQQQEAVACVIRVYHGTILGFKPHIEAHGVRPADPRIGVRARESYPAAVEDAKAVVAHYVFETGRAANPIGLIVCAEVPEERCWERHGLVRVSYIDPGEFKLRDVRFPRFASESASASGEARVYAPDREGTEIDRALAHYYEMRRAGRPFNPRRRVDA